MVIFLLCLAICVGILFMDKFRHEKDVAEEALSKEKWKKKFDNHLGQDVLFEDREARHQIVENKSIPNKSDLIEGKMISLFQRINLDYPSIEWLEKSSREKGSFMASDFFESDYFSLESLTKIGIYKNDKICIIIYFYQENEGLKIDYLITNFKDYTNIKETLELFNLADKEDIYPFFYAMSMIANKKAKFK